MISNKIYTFKNNLFIPWVSDNSAVCAHVIKSGMFSTVIEWKQTVNNLEFGQMLHTEPVQGAKEKKLLFLYLKRHLCD